MGRRGSSGGGFGGGSGGGGGFGGGSGGGRSFGGGNRRGSSGGFGGGSSRSSGGFGGPRRPPGPPPGFGPPPPRGPFFGGPFFGGPYYGGPYRPFYRRRRPAGLGCFSAASGIFFLMVCAVAIVLFLATAFPGSGGSGANLPPSTVRREKLPAGAAEETAWYEDELGWIRKPAILQNGLKSFYDRTGVRPYLYITDNLEGNTAPQNHEALFFAEKRYNELFRDKAHMLLIFFENGDRTDVWYWRGGQTETVLDDEAMEILLDYLERYYYEDNLTDEEMFAKAFSDAGERIMTVTRPAWVIPATVFAGVLLLALVFWWADRRKKRQIEADKAAAELLNTPLETFGDDEAARRAEKYKNS